MARLKNSFFVLVLCFLVSGFRSAAAAAPLPLSDSMFGRTPIPPLSESMLQQSEISQYVSRKSPNWLGISPDGFELFLACNPSRTLDGWRPASEYPELGFWEDHGQNFFLDPKGGSYDIYVFDYVNGEYKLSRSLIQNKFGCVVSSGIACGAPPVAMKRMLLIEYLYEDGSKAAVSQSFEVEAGKVYSYTPPKVPGFFPDPEVVSGTMPDSDLKVKVVYKPADSYALTILYEYEDGRQAAPTKVYQLAYKQYYSYPSPVIANYTASPQTVSGTMSTSDFTQIVIYRKTKPEYTLTINYVYPDGSAAAPAQTYKLAQGASYSYLSPEVRGHAPDVGTVQGVMSKSDKIVTVTYRPKQFTLTIQYVFENGFTAAPTKTLKIPYGDPFGVDSPEVPGYVPDYLRVTGLMLDKDQFVRVVYAPRRKSLTINYELENGGQAFSSRVYQLAAGKTYAYPSPGLAGYTPNIKVVEGTMPNGDKVVTVVYIPVRSDLTIDYVYEDGSRAFRSFSAEYATGQKYDIQSPRISGFYPDISVVRGTMPTHSMTIVVTYYKIGTGPDPGADEEGVDPDDSSSSAPDEDSSSDPDDPDSGGSGSVDCPNCGGTGSVGSGSGNCPDCGGSGSVDGSGSGSGNCPGCGGSGSIVCPDCGGSGSGGSGSGGSGSGGSDSGHCPGCGGSGSIICPDCGGSGSFSGGCPDCGCDRNHCSCGSSHGCPCGGFCRPPSWHEPGQDPGVVIPPGGFFPDGWEDDFGIGEPEEPDFGDLDLGLWDPDSHKEGALQFEDTLPIPEADFPGVPEVKPGEIPSADDPLDPDVYGFSTSKKDLYYYLDKYYGIDGRPKESDS